MSSQEVVPLLDLGQDIKSVMKPVIGFIPNPVGW